MRIHPHLATVVLALLTLQGCSSEEGSKDPETPAKLEQKDGKQDQDKQQTKKDVETKQPDSKDTEKAKPKKYKYADMRLAKMQFKMYCHTCHGLKGKGDGVVGKTLDPRPRNWTDAEWQKSVTDERLFKVIRDGGPSVGLNVMMAPNPDPEYRTTKQEVIWALVAMVRTFSGKE